MTEVWRQIPSHPLYEASSRGRVRSRFRVLKPQLNDDGYFVVSVALNGTFVTRPVHVLVCEAFHGPKKYSVLEVAHNSRTKTNNRPENVRWDTHKGNMADMRRHGTLRHGQRHPLALFTNAQVKGIRAQYALVPKPATIARLAAAFMVSVETIRNIVKRRTWKDVA